MEAKEMFKELGLEEYELVTNDVNYGEPLCGQVSFDKTYKVCICERSITPKLCKAIYKKMEELGWLDEC